MVTIDSALTSSAFTRLIHFTHAPSLFHIFRDGELRSNADLAENSPQQLSPTDDDRFDGRSDLISCSFEFPNLHYQAVAAGRSVNYPDWVALALNRDLLRHPDVEFCPCNASRARGRYLRGGGQGLLDCWASPSIPLGLIRRPDHDPRLPTDLQAEAMIPSPVPLSSIGAVIVPSIAKARELYGLLQRYDLEPGRTVWRASRTMFDRGRLHDCIQRHRPVIEETWTPH
ncbi:DarT ssDNA thymidine ADP-ribosyltransferase family protein [Nocardia brasiliensis]|uniref:DarT ssDNA thymidine ADP-ribosyltransferase family protein n=1 Tax=Nocardia brasiliensis TaxID=37326 RepID=UPI002453FD45|nr:DarT ssDNA thymidine ADP-ribosyltransferase family protein [Nocardia brasiliensis]